MRKLGVFLIFICYMVLGCATTVKDIKTWEKQKNVTLLMKALDDKNTTVSDAAIQSLANVGAPIVGPIINDLKKKKKCSRGNKSKALERITDPEAVNPLVSALRREDACIRATVSLSLVSIGKPSITPLIDVLKDESLDVRKSAAKVLYKLEWEPENDLDRAYYVIANEKWDEVDHLNSVAVEAFVEALKYKRLNRSVSSVLANMGEQAVNPLVTQLKNAQIRRTAAWILSKIGEPAVESLIPVLQDGRIREVVAWILYEIGKPAVKPLIKALENPQVREAVGDALAKIGKPAVKPLILHLKDKDPGIRTAAAKTLGKIGDKRAVEPLALLTKDYDLGVRRAAVRALEAIRW